MLWLQLIVKPLRLWPMTWFWYKWWHLLMHLVEKNYLFSSLGYFSTIFGFLSWAIDLWRLHCDLHRVHGTDRSCANLGGKTGCRNLHQSPPQFCFRAVIHHGTAILLYYFQHQILGRFNSNVHVDQLNRFNSWTKWNILPIIHLIKTWSNT